MPGAHIPEIRTLANRRREGAGASARQRARDPRQTALRPAPADAKRYRSGFFQMPRSCMSLIWRLMTFSRYSACFMGARFR